MKKVKDTTPYYAKPSFKNVFCTKCHKPMKISHDSVSGICYRWVSDMIPVEKPTVKSDKPSGWQRMKLFVDKNGDTYIKGELQPALKGTLPVTEIKPKEPKQPKEKKKRLKQKERLSIQIESGKKLATLKKKLSKTTNKKDVAKLTAEINKQEKLINTTLK